MPATPPPRPRASPSPSSLRSSTKPSRLTQTSLESDSITAPVPVPRPRSGQGFGTPQSSPTPRRALNVPAEVKSVPPPRPQGSPGSSRSGSFSKPYPVKPDLSPEAQSPELSTELKTRVQLFISCTNLVDRDILSKSDPICVVDLLQGSIDSSEGTYREVRYLLAKFMYDTTRGILQSEFSQCSRARARVNIRDLFANTSH